MRKIFEQALLLIVKIYQITLSPLLGPSCRYVPTCSEYMKQAITKYGPLKGSYLGIKRILKCHPWGGHGYDPLP